MVVCLKKKYASTAAGGAQHSPERQRPHRPRNTLGSRHVGKPKWGFLERGRCETSAGAGSGTPTAPPDPWPQSGSGIHPIIQLVSGDAEM